MSGRRSAALPPNYAPPLDGTLDALTDLGASQDTSDTRGVLEGLGTRDTSDTSDTRDTPGIRGIPGTQQGTATNGNHREVRTHVKVRGPLVDEMRDAVWFLSEHGRPRVQLGELIDEAVAEWLSRIKAELNGAEDFPRRGRLR